MQYSLDLLEDKALINDLVNKILVTLKIPLRLKEELYSPVMVGLWRAVKSYKDNKKASFEAWAYFCAKSEVKDYLRTIDKVPRKLRDGIRQGDQEKIASAAPLLAEGYENLLAKGYNDNSAIENILYDRSNHVDLVEWQDEYNHFLKLLREVVFSIKSGERYGEQRYDMFTRWLDGEEMKSIGNDYGIKKSAVCLAIIKIIERIRPLWVDHLNRQYGIS